jgi:DNA-binding transcriptional regulator YhcF (GntR family)
MSGVYNPDDRMPSVREYAASVEVNANTVMRSHEYLSTRDIIYNRRGIGFFVASDARNAIVKMRRDAFLNNDIIDFFKELKMLGIAPDELKSMYQNYCNSQYLTEKQ